MSAPCYTDGRRLTKRPRVGDTVGCKYGPATVLTVHEHGMRITVQTLVHGTETLQRAKNGLWTVYDALVAS